MARGKKVINHLDTWPWAWIKEFCLLKAIISRDPFKKMKPGESVNLITLYFIPAILPLSGPTFRRSPLLLT
jgi:hypothetical protein